MCESWVECVGFSTLSEHYSTFSHVTVEKLYISTPGWNFSTISVYSVGQVRRVKVKVTRGKKRDLRAFAGGSPSIRRQACYCHCCYLLFNLGSIDSEA